MGLITRTSLYHTVQELDIESDRIIGVRVSTTDGIQVVVICVYMPCTKETTSSYIETLQQLEDVCDEYSQIGPVVILGDFNAEVKGAKTPHPHSPRTPLLQEFIKHEFLTSVSVSAVCAGPNYTYDAFGTGNKRSLIDHILVSRYFEDLVVESSIVPRYSSSSVNHSDHLPVVVQLAVNPLHSSSIIMNTRRLNWKKVQPENSLYQTHLSAALGDVQKPRDMSHEAVESYYHKLINCMTAAAQKTVPMRRYNKHLKPRWKTEVEQFHTEMLEKRKPWVDAGKPRSDSDPLYRQYKEAKRIFRRRLRQVMAQDERQLYEDLEERNPDTDAKSLWAHVRRKRGGVTTVGKEVLFGDKVLREPVDIANAWANHYEKIFTPLQHPDFSVTFEDRITGKWRRYLRDTYGKRCEELDRKIELTEVENCVKSLPIGKAGGSDNLSNEHILYGGPILMEHIWWMLKLLHDAEWMPDRMKEGVMIMLPKDKCAKKRTSENQRGITLLSVLYKLYERLILNRFMTWKCNMQITFPDPLQCAYQKSLSSMHASFNLQECVAHNTEQGSKVYTCLLDSSKAFDYVWHLGLFVKLYEIGICGKLWRILINMYSNMKSEIMIDGARSRQFKVQQSVRQGGVLSPWLYMMYINDMITELRHSGHGAYVDNIYCGVVAQADDIALIALSPASLQKMLIVCHNYSCNWRFLYNAAKTKVMVYGETKKVNERNREHRSWFLGNERIPEVTNSKHVGITLSIDRSNSENIKKACKTGKGTFLSLAGAGVRPKGLNPLTSSVLYKSIVLPRALYGCELWNCITNTDMLMLERMHRFCCKQMQGLATRVRSVMVTNMIGLQNIEYFVDKAKLIFLGNVCRLDETAVSRQILVKRLRKGAQSGFTAAIRGTLVKYDLGYVLSDFVDSISFPGKMQWKYQIKSAIEKREVLNRNNLVESDVDFTVYKRTLEPDRFVPSMLWVAAKEHRNHAYNINFTVMCLLSSGNTNEILCHFCGEIIQYEMQHLGTRCPKANTERQIFFSEIYALLSKTLYEQWESLDENDLYASMLGANILCLPVQDHISFILRSSNYLQAIRKYVSKGCSVYSAFKWSRFKEPKLY